MTHVWEGCTKRELLTCAKSDCPERLSEPRSELTTLALCRIHALHTGIEKAKIGLRMRIFFFEFSVRLCRTLLFFLTQVHMYAAGLTDRYLHDTRHKQVVNVTEIYRNVNVADIRIMESENTC